MRMNNSNTETFIKGKCQTYWSGEQSAWRRHNTRRCPQTKLTSRLLRCCAIRYLKVKRNIVTNLTNRVWRPIFKYQSGVDCCNDTASKPTPMGGILPHYLCKVNNESHLTSETLPAYSNTGPNFKLKRGQISVLFIVEYSVPRTVSRIWKVLKSYSLNEWMKNWMNKWVPRNQSTSKELSPWTVSTGIL